MKWLFIHIIILVLSLPLSKANNIPVSKIEIGVVILKKSTGSHQLGIIYRNKNLLNELYGINTNDGLSINNNLGQKELVLKEVHNRRILVVLVVCLSVIVLLLFNYAILKHRSEEKISDQGKKLKAQKERLESLVERIENQNGKLIELSQFKENMMNLVEKDFINQLTAVIDLPDPENKNSLIEQAVHQLLYQLKNLRIIDKFEIGDLKPELKSVDLGKIVSDSVMVFQDVIHKKRLVLESNIPRKTFVLGDEELLKQLLINLIDNSVRHSYKAGNIVVDLINNKAEFVEVHITNDGPSIPKKHHKSIFKKYVQLDRYNSERKNSSGLGLAVCKLVSELHGGAIGVNSSGEVGVDFWFTLQTSNKR